MTLSAEQEQQLSLLGNLHPLPKLLLVSETVALAFLGNNGEQALLALTLWFGMLLALWVTARVRVYTLRQPLALGAVASLIIIVSQGFLYRYNEHQTTLFSILINDAPGNLPLIFTLEGLVAGLDGALKLLCVLACSLLVVSTTELDELAYALLALKIPYSFTFLLLSTMRLVPLVQSTWNDLLDARRLRGYDLERTSIVQRISHLYPRVLASLLVVLLKFGIQLEISIRTRGFGLSAKRTHIFARSLHTRDYVFELVILAVFIPLLLWQL